MLRQSGLHQPAINKAAASDGPIFSLVRKTPVEPKSRAMKVMFLRPWIMDNISFYEWPSALWLDKAGRSARAKGAMSAAVSAAARVPKV